MQAEPVSSARLAGAHARLDQLAKPPGSLAALEAFAARSAAIQQSLTPALEPARVLVFAAEHGVARSESVSPYPSSVTHAMIRTMATGKAAVCAFARTSGASVEVINVGTSELGVPASDPEVSYVDACVRRQGSRNLRVETAMDEREVTDALQAGASAVARAHDSGVRTLLLGEMGIGNTTSASVLTAYVTGTDSDRVVGPGTGLDLEGIQHKRQVVRDALARVTPQSPRQALAEWGGLEIAALVGAMIAAAERRIVVVVDGFIVTSAALVACAIEPDVRDYLIPATRSAEPGHVAALQTLNAGQPVLDLGLRLGEASGAVAALGVLRCACSIFEMATLEEVLSGS